MSDLSTKSLLWFNVFLYTLVTGCLLNLVLYDSPHLIFFSILSVVFFLTTYFLIKIVGRIEYVITFIIAAYTFYSFTIAPFSKFTEDGAFFVIGPLIFLALVFIQGKDISKLRLTLPDKILVFIILSTLLLSNTLFNPDEIKEDQGILKMISVGGSLILFVNYFPSFLYEKKNTLNNFLGIIMIVGIIAAIFGILTMFYSLNPLNENYGYAISFFKHPNATSSMYGFSIPIIIWFLIFKKTNLSFGEKTFLIIGLALSFIALLFTFSRFGIFSIFVSILILVFRYSRKLFFGILLLSMLLSSYLIANFFSAKGSLTILGRIGLVQTAFEMYSDLTKFLFGYGGVSTRIKFEKIKSSIGVSDPNNNPHNIILYSILLHGVIFTTALFVFFFKYYFKSIKQFIRNKGSDIFILSLSVCSGMFLKNMAEDLLFFQEFFMWYLFLIFFGFLIIEINGRTRRAVND